MSRKDANAGTGKNGGRAKRPFVRKPVRRRTAPAERSRQAATPAKDAWRIARVIARAGLASRREAEAWIAAGRVAVNGTVITSPALNITAADQIVVDGKPLPARERTRL